MKAFLTVVAVSSLIANILLGMYATQLEYAYARKTLECMAGELHE